MRITVPPPITEDVTFAQFVAQVVEYDDRFNFAGYDGFAAAARLEATVAKATPGQPVDLLDGDLELLSEAVRHPRHRGQPGTWPLNARRRLLLPFADAILGQ